MTARQQAPGVVPPPPPPPVRRRVVYSSLIAQLGKAKAELDAAQERYDALVRKARVDLPLGRHVEGDVEVMITKNRFWDRAAAHGQFGDAICTPAVDQSMARAVMTGAQYDAFYVDQPPRVTVKKAP